MTFADFPNIIDYASIISRDLRDLICILNCWSKSTESAKRHAKKKNLVFKLIGGEKEKKKKKKKKENPKI